MKYVILVLYIATLVGCASSHLPSPSLIESVPVVRVGTSDDVPDDHIVYIPAKTDFPIEFSIKGSLFSEDQSTSIDASFMQDVYLYKFWASLDGKKWVRSHKLINVKPSGGFDKSGGKVEIGLDLDP